MPIVSALETSSGQKVTANDSEPPIINIWRMLADFRVGSLAAAACHGLRLPL